MMSVGQFEITNGMTISAMDQILPPLFIYYHYYIIIIYFIFICYSKWNKYIDK